MNGQSPRLSRRKFLFTVGAGGVAGAGALVATNRGTESSKPGGEGKRATRGYAESEHIRNYYRTAKV